MAKKQWVGETANLQIHRDLETIDQLEAEFNEALKTARQLKSDFEFRGRSIDRTYALIKVREILNEDVPQRLLDEFNDRMVAEGRLKKKTVKAYNRVRRLIDENAGFSIQVRKSGIELAVGADQDLLNRLKRRLRELVRLGL